MDGIEILATTEPLVQIGFCWPIVIIGMLVGAIVFGISAGVQEKSISVGLGVAFFGMACGMLITLIPAIMVGSKNDVYETRYLATIDETVSLTEFYDRYEILEKTGELYTIREKNVENG